MSIAQGDHEMSHRMRTVIAQMRESYEKVLWSEESGWLGSWRSRDGELHDYGMLSQNAAACVYGLVSPERARGIIRTMEQARVELGVGDASYGFPSSLKPIPMDDQAPFIVGTAYRWDGQDAHGVYCNGTMSHLETPISTFGLCRNMVRKGMPTERPPRYSMRISILMWSPEEGTGCEFHTFEGATCGYEGAYVLQFPILLAIAQHNGWVARSAPEFWPIEAEC